MRGALSAPTKRSALVSLHAAVLLFGFAGLFGKWLALSPELIVLGGGIGSNPALLAPVRATVAELVSLTARIETSTLGDKAALHGALALALRQARAQMLSARPPTR